MPCSGPEGNGEKGMECLEVSRDFVVQLQARDNGGSRVSPEIHTQMGLVRFSVQVPFDRWAPVRELFCERVVKE